MSSRGIIFETARAERLALVKEARPEAHGASLWSLPKVASRDGGLFEVTPRGDAVRDSIRVVKVDHSEATSERHWIAIDELRAAWANGRPLAPEVTHALRWLEGETHEPLGTWEVVPHVHVLPLRTATLPPATHTNAFLIGSGEMIFVEPGANTDPEVEHVRACVDLARSRGRTLMAIVSTHHHLDHVAGAQRLSDALGVPLWAHRETALRCPGLRFERFLEEGDVIELRGSEPTLLEVMHTPGHAAGHVVLVEPKSKLMIAGDMVAGVGTILIEPGDGDMNVYLAQLDRLAESSGGALVPAHGGLVVDGAAAFRATAAHRRAREDKVRGALTAVAQTTDGLLGLVYGDVPRALWPLAKLSLDAHLLGLEARGEATRAAGGWALASDR